MHSGVNDPAAAHRRRMTVLLALLTLGHSYTALADHALVAVAANFSEVAARLEHAFEASGEHSLTLAAGSTGKLYAQLQHGAPFDVLLAADERRPALLEQSGMAVAGTRRIYAIGRLALWSPDADTVADNGADTLRAAAFRRLAIANPELAPYGTAAREVLQALGLWDVLSDKIVMGENIGQTHVLVATGNAELGFVALSYVVSPRNTRTGSRWVVPQTLHAPIAQALVLLQHGKDNAAARAFVAYLATDAARSVIESYGYDTD